MHVLVSDLLAKEASASSCSSWAASILAVAVAAADTAAGIVADTAAGIAAAVGPVPVAETQLVGPLESEDEEANLCCQG